MARRVKLGSVSLDFPSSDLQTLEPCKHALDNIDGLKEELENTGYLYLQNFHPREAVLTARLAVLQFMDELQRSVLDPAHSVEEGVFNHRCGKGCVPFMEGHNDITHDPRVLEVIAGDHARRFFTSFFGEEATTFDFKWLRAVHQQGFTGAHVDHVYMGRGTSQLLTMWTPLGDICAEMGVLAMCEGSHRLPGFQKYLDSYGSFDIEENNLNGTGWFTCNPLEITQQFGGQWKTTDFKAGDAMIFTMKTTHMSTVNLTRRARISCDTRWQAKSAMMDPRYVGTAPMAQPKFGLYGEDSPKPGQVTIEKMKEKWGFKVC